MEQKAEVYEGETIDDARRQGRSKLGKRWYIIGEQVLQNGKQGTATRAKLRLQAVCVPDYEPIADSLHRQGATPVPDDWMSIEPDNRGWTLKHPSDWFLATGHSYQTVRGSALVLSDMVNDSPLAREESKCLRAHWSVDVAPDAANTHWEPRWSPSVCFFTKQFGRHLSQKDLSRETRQVLKGIYSVLNLRVLSEGQLRIGNRQARCYRFLFQREPLIWEAVLVADVLNRNTLVAAVGLQLLGSDVDT
jgi:hypothetical protein